MITYKLIDADTEEVLTDNILSTELTIKKMREYLPTTNNINFSQTSSPLIRFNSKTIGWLEPV